MIVAFSVHTHLFFHSSTKTSVMFIYLSNYRYKFNDPEFIKIMDWDDDFLEVFGRGGPPEDFIPGLRYVWESKGMRTLREGTDWMNETIIRKKYKEHEETFDKGRDILIEIGRSWLYNHVVEFCL